MNDFWKSGLAAVGTEFLLGILLCCLCLSGAVETKASEAPLPSDFVYFPSVQFTIGPIGENAILGLASLETIAAGLPDVDIDLPSVKLIRGGEPEWVYRIATRFKEQPAYGSVGESGYMILLRTDQGEARLSNLDSMRQHFSNRIKRRFSENVVHFFEQRGHLPAKPNDSWEFVLLVPRWEERLIANLEQLLLEDMALSPQEVELLHLDLGYTKARELPRITQVLLKNGEQIAVPAAAAERAESALQELILTEG